MIQWRWRLLVLVVGLEVSISATGFAADRKTPSTADTNPVQASYQQDNGEGSPFREEAAEPPMPEDLDHEAIATDQEPATEPSADASKPTAKAATPLPLPLPREMPGGNTLDPAYVEAPYDSDFAVANSRCGGCGCSDCRSSCGCQAACGCGGGCCHWPLTGITLGGWLDQGATTNSRFPRDRFNGPVTFNDRDGEYQMNQLWVYAEKVTNTGGCGWDIGGRVDFVYGTDWRFTATRGLEDDWNSRRFYGAALPQLYMDVAVNDLTVRMGHFYTTIGYEVVPAPDNFFYSHSYAFQYGEPISHTGLQATYDVDKQLSLSAGFNRGWNRWEDNNTDLSFLGGATCTSYDGRTSIALALSTGDYDDAGQLNRTMYSLVVTHRANDRFSYVVQYDWGRDENGGVRGLDGGWYDINNEMFYVLDEQWTLGLRVEWFRDADGTRVGGIGAPHGWTSGPNIEQGLIGWAGTFWEITLGANWQPCENVVVRPECRWDWYGGQAAAGDVAPFNSGRNNSQFLFGTDMIVTF